MLAVGVKCTLMTVSVREKGFCLNVSTNVDYLYSIYQQNGLIYFSVVLLLVQTDFSNNLAHNPW